MIFADTGAWFESFGRQGPPTEQVKAVVEARGSEVVTSGEVLTELWNLLGTRGRGHQATSACTNIATRYAVVHSDAGDHQNALRILAAWSDRTFSYADAMSFALMERHAIIEALSFDEHFRAYRYGPGRRQAFTVLP